jgi:hypothetical protein
MDDMPFMPIWSKLKRAVEDLLADSVKQRLQFYTTRYGPGVSTIMTRAWVTWDGREIASFSNIEHMRAQNTLAAEIRTNDELQPPASVYQQADALLDERGIMSQSAFYSALSEYVSLSIDEAVHSPNRVIKGWAMFDRRLGKRRLRALWVTDNDPAFVQQCYKLRCQAEGIALAQWN